MGENIEAVHKAVKSIEICLKLQPFDRNHTEDLSHFTQLPDSECEEEEEEVVEQEEEEEYYEPAAVVQPPVFNQQHKDNRELKRFTSWDNLMIFD